MWPRRGKTCTCPDEDGNLDASLAAVGAMLISHFQIRRNIEIER
jgi:hypothetical protein